MECIFSQLIRFAKVRSHVDDINARNKCLTAKLLIQGYRYQLRKAFSKFYRRHQELVLKFKCRIRISFTSRPGCYGDLVYKFKNIMCRTDFF